VNKSVFVVIALLAYGLFGVGSSLLAGETVIVEMKKYKFIPEEITVKVGTTVRWVNKEKRQYHSVWFREAGDKDSGYFWPDETFERTFDEPGVYPYVCEPHEGDYDMKGVVRVVP
jgi:plastocyanin